MSTFGGLMVEYPQIAIDRFQGDAVLKARGYFLSHCHSDHMVGLNSKKFADRLKCNPNIKLFCSEVTYEFLLTDDRYKHLQASLFSLPIEQTSTVTLMNELNGEEEKLLVTLLPAGHCPGSVMFLFEGDQGTVLYTGDFRLAKGEAARMEPLHSGSRVKDIVSVYLDTTFCVPEAMYIPSREESKDALLDLVDRQISKSIGHMVKLNCKAKYGYEYLFVELSKTFNQKIHVSDVIMRQYDRVPDLRDHLTTEGSLTQIHACRYEPCSLKNAANILMITPSTMWFTGNARPDDVVKKVGHRYRLCFSFHSSFSEIRDFLSYIRPENVYPNVIPYNSSEEEVIKRLQDCLRNKKTDVTQGCDVSMTTDFQPFGSLKSIRKTNRKRQHDRKEDDFHHLFDSSPEKQKKKVEHSMENDNQAKDNEVIDSKPMRESTGSMEGIREKSNGHTSDALPWEHVKGREDTSYSCTFADSDGVLSDSEESECDEEEIDRNNPLNSLRVGQTNGLKERNAGHKINYLKCADDGRTGKDALSGDDDNGWVEGEKGRRREEKDCFQEEEEEEEDSESIINPSQSSINDGSMALFSDDSHQGDSQKSGCSSNNWLQYLPTSQTPTKTPSPQERINNEKHELREGDGVHKTAIQAGSLPSLILISDDDGSACSDSDVTQICSQRSIRSDGSSVNDIEVISMTPGKTGHSPRCGLKTREHDNCTANLDLDKDGVSNPSRTEAISHPSGVETDELANLGNQGSRQEIGADNTSSLESVIEISSSP